jgi:hypothetical protein
MFHIRRAICGIGQEVERGSIVPDINWIDLPVARDISLEPAGHAIVGAQARAGPIERRPGYIQHRDAGEPARHQVIDETGIPASNVDDSRRRVRARCLEEMERGHRRVLKPTDFVARPRGVHVVPVPFPL